MLGRGMARVEARLGSTPLPRRTRTTNVARAPSFGLAARGRRQASEHGKGILVLAGRDSEEDGLEVPP